MLDHIEDWDDAPVWTPQAIADATRDWFKFLSATNSSGGG
jgi:UDP-glucose 4-epimerase